LRSVSCWCWCGQAWGHSLAADPWGEVLASADDTEQTLLVNVDLARLAEVRAQIPLNNQRRLDVYRRPAPVLDDTAAVPTIEVCK
jgi:hypothetical protein